jgi:hypothetical protein
VDTTPDYVKMCTLAVEVQARWVPLPWDYISCRVDQSVTCLLPGKPVSELNSHWCDGKLIQGLECCGSKVEHVWLPRQDQLQDFMFKIPRRIPMYMMRFAKFASHKWTDSVEQMWLRYVMFIVYKKRWHIGLWIHQATK